MDRAVPPPAASTRTGSDPRSPRRSAGTFSPAGVPADDRPLWPRSLAPIKTRPPSSSRGAAAVSPPSSPCTRRRTSCTHPRSPATVPERTRSARWFLPRSAAGPDGRTRSVFLLPPDRVRSVRASTRRTRDGVLAAGCAAFPRRRKKPGRAVNPLRLFAFPRRFWKPRSPGRTSATDRRSTVRYGCRFWR